MQPPSPAAKIGTTLSTLSFTSKAGNNPSSATRAAAAREIYANLSNAFNNLAGMYDALHAQTTQVALLGSEIGGAHNVQEFRQRMRKQDLEQKEGIAEIQHIIDDVLRSEGDEMREQVNKEIADQIDKLVEEQVAQCLKDHIPEDLQLELAENRREYEQLQLALHNSESRRLNGTLRASRSDDALHSLVKSNGTLSPLFPKDLKGLFNLDAADLKALMADYDITGVGDSRDANLNKFMQFCGVKYQLVKHNHAKPDNANAAS